MTPDSSALSNLISPSIMEILTFFVVVFTFITAYITIKKFKQTKPKIARLITSANGSKVVLSVINPSNITIKVDSVYIKKYLFLFVKSSKIDVVLHKKNDADIVIPPSILAEDNIIFSPPDSVYFSKYKVYIDTSVGSCTKIYDPNSVVGLSRDLFVQHIISLKNKRK
ncbi:MAG: hypothetical protein Q8N03_13730 [Ignavibacteria bacterium]|nr:hypothetical protein [Ignavibacteria bacterium]MDP3829816.1 hypothetical protein [Ignavibacteriaceae bacterium]